MVKQIELTQGKVAIVDDVDFEWLSQWSWCVNSTGYAVRGTHIEGRCYLVLMHREIVARMGLSLLEDGYVDHANRNRLDNRRSNLRWATPTESSYNVRKTNKHGYRGVTYLPYCYKNQKRYLRSKPWQARIRIEGRVRHLSLGYYVTAEEAARAYDQAAKVHHGEFATLNFSGEV